MRRERNSETKMIRERDGDRGCLPGYRNEDEMRFKIDGHTIKQMTTARNNKDKLLEDKRML